MKKFAPLCITILLFFFYFDSTVFAQGTSGLYNPVFGARALAQGNAFTARADDASAIQFNPAGLTQLDRPQISAGGSLLYPAVEYHGDGGDEVMHTTINTLPNFYFASPIIKDKLAAGLGVTVPYGLQGKWDGDGFSRYLVTDFKLSIINVNPTITYKPLSFLSIGAGFDYYYADSHQESKIPIAQGIPDGSRNLDSSGDGFGYNAGILYTITPQQSVGFSFRSKADLNLDGKLKLTDLSIMSDFHTRTSTSAQLPEMLSFGYAYKHGERWSIEADVQWTNWSRFDTLNIRLDQPDPSGTSEYQEVWKWHNTWSFGLGGEYKLSDALKARGGYTFHESPVSGETLEPSVPQSSRHALFTGLGYGFGKKKNQWIDLAYGIVFYENREVNNTVGDAYGTPIDGHFDILTQIVALNYNYKF